MINGQTVEEYNAMQRERGSIVSKLHGYKAYSRDDTMESLKAEFLALTGEVYRTREEEAADLVAAAEVRRKKRKVAQETIDRTQIAVAWAKGFKDCNEVFDFLGIPEINAGGIRRSKFQVATQYILEAGVKLVVIIEDGYSDVPKGERHGCWGTDLPQVINYVNAKNAKRDYDEWKAAYDSAVEERNLHGAQTRNMDWDVYIESLGPEPPQPDFDPDAVNASVQRQEQVVTINPTRRLAIVAALRSYMAADLPLNSNFLPKRNLLNAHARFKIAGWEKRECWTEAQNG